MDIEFFFRIYSHIATLLHTIQQKYNFSTIGGCNMKPKYPRDHSQENNKSPNFLIILVDEERFPTAYENEALKEWRKNHLKTQELLRENGMTFLNHYIGSTACSPSRTTLYTGQYPSLHGVTQTTGAAKGAFDLDVYWLDHNTVPTLGDYFRSAGYRTFW